MGKKTMKILVTGANGLVGNSLRNISTKDKVNSYTFIGRDYGDLRDKNVVYALFSRHQPDYVIHTAAKVGGIGGNEANHGDFFYDNLMMNAHIINYSKYFDVKKLIVFSSVCVFPHDLATLQEDKMHDGKPFESNFAYAYAKRMIDIQIEAYRRQFGITNYCSVIPGNIFGEHDWYSVQHGHVVPSLIHKLFIAKRDGTPFQIWGDGKSLREFLYVEDVAKIIVKLLHLDSLPQRLIISGSRQYSIREVVDKLVKVAGFTGEVAYQLDKPNGQRSRPTDLSLLNSLFKMEYTDIDAALATSWKWFVDNYPNVRL